MVRLIDMTAADLTALVDSRLEAFLGNQTEEEGCGSVDPARALTRKQAAQFLAVSLSQLDLLSRRKVDPVPYYLAGDSRRYPRLELIEWLRRQRAANG